MTLYLLCKCRVEGTAQHGARAVRVAGPRSEAQRDSRPCPKGSGKLWEAVAWSGVRAGKVSRPRCAEGLMERPRRWGRQSWGDGEAPPCES